MTEVAWDYDWPVKNYSLGNLNCRWVNRGVDVVLAPVPSFWSIGLTISALIASTAFVVFACFADEILWQVVSVALAIVFPIAGLVVGRMVDSYEGRRGPHLVFLGGGRISLPRYQVEIRPDENTEFRCHRYWFYGDQVEDLVLHHADTTYWVFSSGVAVSGPSGAEKLRRELEEHLGRRLALQSRA